MMIVKTRNESNELKILSFLDKRIRLPDDTKQNYLNLKKGYEGEVMFDSLTAKLQCNCLILNDLLLKYNHSTFQIDSLIIKESLHLFEVKNFEGDYYFESDNFYTISKKKLNNPLHQMNRCETLLRQLLDKHGFKLPIKSHVVFINPEFTLYQAPENKPILYPTQINRFMKGFDLIPANLNTMHKKLANQLISCHQKDPPYQHVPAYHYDQLKKGITCAHCLSFSISVIGKKCICKKCGYTEDVEASVIRSVEEFKLLFPNKKVTTNYIHQWCQVVESKKRISRILGRNYKIVGVRQWAYYK